MTEQPLPAAPALPSAPSGATALAAPLAPPLAAPPAAPPVGDPFPGGRGPAPMTPADETTWSTVAHLSWVAGSFVGLPFLAPVVLFLVLRERGPFVRHHTAEALNLQLSLLVYGLGLAVVGGVLSVLTFGVAVPVFALAGVALVVAGVVLSVIAAVASSRGQWYRYPWTVRFVR